MNTETPLFNAEWFPMYHRRFLASTIAWDAQAIGAYFLLLCSQWDNGYIPTDPKEQRRIGRCSYHALEKVTTKFTICDDGLMKNKKLEEVREKQHKKYLQGLKRADNMNNKRGQKPTSDVTSDVTLHVTDRDKDKDEENDKSFKKNNNKKSVLNDNNQNAESVNATPVAAHGNPPNVAAAENVAANNNTIAPANTEAANSATPDDGANPFRDRDMLLETLNESESIIEMLCMQIGCNPYEAKCMRIMFTRHIIGTGTPVTNIVHLRAYCVNWCRSHAPVLLNTLNNKPQRRR